MKQKRTVNPKKDTGITHIDQTKREENEKKKKKKVKITSGTMGQHKAN